MEYIQREDWFQITPVRFGQWLFRETFERWPDDSIVNDFKPYPPEPFRVEHGIALGVELIPSDSKEPVTVPNAIRFWMLQTSDYPNVTHIRSKCATGAINIDHGAVIDYQAAVACFETIWAKMYLQFQRVEMFQVSKSDMISNEVYRKGLDEDRETLYRILSEIQRVHKEQAVIARTVESLRMWAKAIQQYGLPPDKNLQDSIKSLAQDVENMGGITQYFEVNLPLIPGILNYKFEVGSEHTAHLAELARLWDELKKPKNEVGLDSVERAQQVVAPDRLPRRRLK